MFLDKCRIFSFVRILLLMPKFSFAVWHAYLSLHRVAYSARIVCSKSNCWLKTRTEVYDTEAMMPRCTMHLRSVILFHRLSTIIHSSRVFWYVTFRSSVPYQSIFAMNARPRLWLRSCADTASITNISIFFFSFSLPPFQPAWHEHFDFLKLYYAPSPFVWLSFLFFIQHAADYWL